MIPDEVLAILQPLVQSMEGCRLTSYQDPNKVWTIGWGHTGPSVGPNQVCTQQEADDWLAGDLSTHYNQTVAISPTLAQQPAGRQAAITDFVYNLGAGTYTHSTLRSAVDCGAWQNVKIQLALWVHAGGKVEPGLVRRREAEIALIDA
jgi:lysozyme